MRHQALGGWPGTCCNDLDMPRVILLLALAGSLAAAEERGGTVQPVSHHRVRLGGIRIGAGYSYFSGPFFPGFYYPWFWDPIFDPFYSFYSPYYFNGFARGPGMGEIKLETQAKDAEVYLDGAYAGLAGERKNMWLDPGVYNFEVRSAGGASFSRRIYVLSGKTLKIKPALEKKP